MKREKRLPLLREKKELDIKQIYLEARRRWLHPPEICKIIQNHDIIGITPEAPNRPQSGFLFLLDRALVPHFRKDGHNWRKESHEKLKDGGVNVLQCFYAHGEDKGNFQRRSYWMLEEERCHIVLVHYLEVQGNRMNFNCVRDANVTPDIWQTKEDVSNHNVDGSVASGFQPCDYQKASQVAEELQDAQSDMIEDMIVQDAFLTKQSAPEDARDQPIDSAGPSHDPVEIAGRGSGLPSVEARGRTSLRIEPVTQLVALGEGDTPFGGALMDVDVEASLAIDISGLRSKHSKRSHEGDRSSDHHKDESKDKGKSKDGGKEQYGSYGSMLTADAQFGEDENPQSSLQWVWLLKDRFEKLRLGRSSDQPHPKSYPPSVLKSRTGEGSYDLWLLSLPDADQALLASTHFTKVEENLAHSMMQGATFGRQLALQCLYFREMKEAAEQRVAGVQSEVQQLKDQLNTNTQSMQEALAEKDKELDNLRDQNNQLSLQFAELQSNFSQYKANIENEKKQSFEAGIALGEENFRRSAELKKMLEDSRHQGVLDCVRRYSAFERL